ncbi:mechanosensitive ion channel [Chitinophagaceae bacterium LB-8]|uniref:Mechanosensitive ion channel n=1 Tax=Paraflavisolibacter caeni TaxID=2982496 RepID=A0A9X2XQ13_9BACT|nr:mechanosensitive ion channel domain-containing protein [Paraflavisolibacter caeni]MCU7552359.1 mechanosensitive ion channel [Paraflavisolibacter caeni]
MNWEKFYDKAYGWILNVGPRLIIAIVVFFIGLWLIRILKGALSRHMLRRNFDASLQPFLVSLTVTALNILLVITMIQVIGLQLSIFTTIIGALGVAAGLALSGTLQNFASGVLILLLKPFEVGDSIIAQGHEGIVSSIQIFFTIIRTHTNTTVVIPNSKLSNEVIVNLSREGKRRLDIEMKFGFGISFDAVKPIIQKRIDEIDAILKDPNPRFGVSTVELDGYKVMINLWVPANEFLNVKLKLQEMVINDLKDAQLKFPSKPSI